MRRRPWLVAGLTAPTFAIALILVRTGSDMAPIPGAESLYPAADPAIFASIPQRRVDIPAPVVPRDSSADDTVRTIVDEGDSLGRIFRRYGLSQNDLDAMLRLSDAADYLEMLTPGNAIVATHEAGRVLALERQIDDIRTLRIVRQSDGFAANIIERAPWKHARWAPTGLSGTRCSSRPGTPASPIRSP